MPLPAGGHGARRRRAGPGLPRQPARWSTSIAPDDRRAEVVSGFLLACFVGNSVPVIGVGVLTTLTDPLRAGIVFAVTIAGFALVALAFRRRAGRFA